LSARFVFMLVERRNFGGKQPTPNSGVLGSFGAGGGGAGPGGTPGPTAQAVYFIWGMPGAKILSSVYSRGTKKKTPAGPRRFFCYNLPPPGGGARLGKPVSPLGFSGPEKKKKLAGGRGGVGPNPGNSGGKGGGP